MKNIRSSLKKKKKKCNNMVVNDIKISVKRKNKGCLSIKKDIVKCRKKKNLTDFFHSKMERFILSSKYKKLFSSCKELVFQSIYKKLYSLRRIRIFWMSMGLFVRVRLSDM